MQSCDTAVSPGAAEHLHKVQSAVSHQVRKIKEQLGVKVSNLDGCRVRITPAGEAIPSREPLPARTGGARSWISQSGRGTDCAAERDALITNATSRTQTCS